MNNSARLLIVHANCRSLNRRQGAYKPSAEFRSAKSTSATCSIETEAAEHFPDVLSAEAVDFVAALEREFAQQRRHIIQSRNAHADYRQHGGSFEFLFTTAGIRNDPV